MTRAKRPPRSEAGFTLIEALVAVIVLSFGLIAVTNLLLVAASSNAVANHSTAAAAIASREMERLKSLGITDPCLNPGGTLEPALTDYQATTDTSGACIAGVYATRTSVPGVGTIEAAWTIRDVGPGVPAAKFITVRAEGAGMLTGRRSRAEFTTIRTANPNPIPTPTPGPTPTP